MPDYDPSVARFQVIVQGDDGDQLWELDSYLTASLSEARAIAEEMLRLARRTNRRKHKLRAWIWQGKMVNLGDEESPDWTFRADPQRESELVK